MLGKRDSGFVPAPRKCDCVLFVVIAGAGLVLSLVTFYAVRGWERDKLESRFNHASEARTSLFQCEFTHHVTIVETLASFFQGSTFVERDEFKTFIEPQISTYTELLALQWIPRVPDINRVTHDETAHNNGFTDYEIREEAPDGSIVTASRRDEYYPILYVEPLDGNFESMGIDLGANQIRLRELEWARDTGLAVATSRIEIVKDDREMFGIQLYMPVYKPFNTAASSMERRESLLGFVGAVYNVESSFETALEDLEPAGIDICIHDQSAPDYESFLYRHSSRMTYSHNQELFYTLSNQHAGLRHEVEVEMAGRSWMLVCTPAEEFLAANQDWYSWLVLAMGLFLTLALTTFVVSTRNRTARIEALVRDRTAELAESMQKYRFLAENLDDVVLSISPAGTLTYCSPAITRFGGYNPDDEINVDIGNYFADETELANAWDNLREMAVNHNPTSMEFLFKPKEGVPFPVEISGNPIIKDDEMVAIQCVMRDITERKQAQEEVRKLSTAIEQSPVSIVITDPKGDIEYVNPKFCDLTGYSVEEAIGQNPRILKGGKTSEEEYEELWNTIISGRTWTGEFYNIKKNGEYYWERATISPIKNELGEITHLLGVKEDITDHKAAEEALRITKQEVEDTNSQLEISIERANGLALDAELANVAKSEFLANMSHEIRTPMNGIIGMTGLLMETELSPEQRKFTETVKSSSESLLAIINDILDFSKIEAGKLDLEDLDFNLRSTIEDLLDLLAIPASQKGLELICLVEPDVPSRLMGDPGRLRQIVVNLASNAIKFTASGEVSIHVSLEQEDLQGVVIRFEITDTGIGISQDQIDILWDPFMQGDASIKRRFGGTGLGLSISKQLVELMGGRIGVNSVEGEGTTFWFTVVLRKQPAHAELPQGEEQEIKGIHVLFVDGNATNRRLLSTLFDSWGCSYEEAHDAESALAKLYAAVDEGNPFTVALLDMYIPGMTGEELGVKIKEDPILCDTILVMLTSLGKRVNATKLQEAGFAAFLTKPIKQSSLYDILITVLVKKERPLEKPDESIITSHSVKDAGRQKIRILLAEDNVVNQEVAMKILEKFGYRADAVSNGHEVIKALESIPYDLVLMDCQMPEMDGYAATKIVRDMNTKVLNRNVPIIAMTANALPADRIKCIESGMDDYLPKPVKPADLAECIHKWISSAENEKLKIMASLVTDPKDQVFDKEHLLERLMGDKAILPIIIEQFCNDLPERIDTLKKALHQGDALIVKIQAHSIESAAGNIGANALQKILLQIKTAAREKNLAKAASLISALDEQLEILQQALSVYLTPEIALTDKNIDD